MPVNASRPQRVFLVGMMGSGKSTVGAALSELLSWPYRDNDEALRDAAGATVSGLSVELGWDGLHDLEAEQASRVAAAEPPVVAGIAASITEYPELWQRLRDAGWVVYLRARADTLAARVGSGENRPWLAPDPATFIARTLDARAHRYEELADVTVDVDDPTPGQTAHTIADLLPLASGRMASGTASDWTGDMTTTPFAEPAVELTDGVPIPLVGFGTWQLRGSEAQRAVGWALDAGYRHLDTATGYGNEKQVGAAMRDSGVARDDIFVTTKMPPNHAGRERKTLEESLAALGTDHLDLWLVHWPPGGTAGVSSWRVFNQALAEGLTRAIGVSNYSLEQVDEITEATGVAPAANQIKWSPLLFDADLLAEHRKRGVVVEGYSPFRAGTLNHPTLVEIADRHGKRPEQIVVRWHVQHGIVVIPKSAKQERIAANADVFDFELTADEMTAIDGLRGS